MKRRILFVDDEPSFLDGLRRLLHAHRETWDMHFVTSVDAALDSLRNAPADAVVSDVAMPGATGFDLLAALPAIDGCEDLPVIMVTGVHEHDLKRRALDLGAADLLSKPVAVEDLVARLRNALRLKACRDGIKARNAHLEQKVAERTKALAESRLDLIWRLARVAEYRDEETGNHIIRVGHYCRTIAETLGLAPEFCETLFHTSPLHDIGKIGIPDHILLKPARLTPEEWTVMKQHCAIGAAILRQDVLTFAHLFGQDGARRAATPAQEESSLLPMASAIALSHHEWWDGTGYPYGLAGETIPLEARIVAVADVYDALFSARPYKPAYPESVVLTAMRDQAGRHFDPAVHAAFEQALETFRAIRTEFADETNPVCG